MFLLFLVFPTWKTEKVTLILWSEPPEYLKIN